MTKQTIFVIVPAYNEAGRIKRTVSSIPKTIQVKKKIYHVKTIVVNDGSKDDTQKVLTTIPGIIQLSHIINIGAGGATRTGIAHALSQKPALIVTMDADGQHHHEDLVKVSQEALSNNYDFVIGTRLINPEGMPLRKRVGNRGLSILTYLVLGVWSTDSQSGLRAFSPKAAEIIRWQSNGFGFCSEMLFSSHKHKIQLNEVGIRAIYDEYSMAKGQSNWNALNIIRSLISARTRSIFYE